MRVLIADDDLTTRLTLAMVVRELGYEPVEAENGLAAWEALRLPDGPLLALIDWMMPGIEGLEVCRRVREIPKTIPPYIILVTSRGDKEDKMAGFEAGVDDYIVKPFDADELLARLRVGERFIQLQRALAAKVEDLESAMNHIKRLQGMLPICSNCHKIRDDRETWQKLERYIERNSDAKLSHTLCPDCLRELYPDYADEVEREQKREAEAARNTREKSTH